MSENAVVCNCDYSYVCSFHQTLIDLELEKTTNLERAERVDKRVEWIIQSIKALAEKMAVELPEEP